MAQEPRWNFDKYDWIHCYDERMRGKERLRYEETLARLPQLAGVKPGDRVLDVGTGTGNSALPFLQSGCTVVGLDPSERMLELARRKASPWEDRLLLQRAEAPFLSIPCADAEFDAVVSAYAFHHLDDEEKRRAVVEMKRVLKPGGRIVIADTMFRDEAHKAQALREHTDLEDEFQPFLSPNDQEKGIAAIFVFADMFADLHQIGPLVWVVVARAC